MKHTPGPWELLNDAEIVLLEIAQYTDEEHELMAREMAQKLSDLLQSHHRVKNPGDIVIAR